MGRGGGGGHGGGGGTLPLSRAGVVVDVKGLATRGVGADLDKSDKKTCKRIEGQEVGQYCEDDARLVSCAHVPARMVRR